MIERCDAIHVGSNVVASAALDASFRSRLRSDAPNLSGGIQVIHDRLEQIHRFGNDRDVVGAIMDASSIPRAPQQFEGRLTGIDGMHAWRGRFIDEFATAEGIVSEALVKLSAMSSSGGDSLLPHLVGQRFAALRCVTGPSGPLSHIGPRVSAVLDEFRELHRHRTFLCHGRGESAIDRAGKWRLTLRLVDLRPSAERSTLVIGQEDAAVLLDRLCSARVRLDGQLSGMLASMERERGTTGLAGGR